MCASYHSHAGHRNHMERSPDSGSCSRSWGGYRDIAAQTDAHHRSGRVPDVDGRTGDRCGRRSASARHPPRPHGPPDRTRGRGRRAPEATGGAEEALTRRGASLPDALDRVGRAFEQRPWLSARVMPVLITVVPDELVGWLGPMGWPLPAGLRPQPASAGFVLLAWRFSARRPAAASVASQPRHRR